VIERLPTLAMTFSSCANAERVIAALAKMLTQMFQIAIDVNQKLTY